MGKLDELKDDCGVMSSVPLRCRINSITWMS